MSKPSPKKFFVHYAWTFPRELTRSGQDAATCITCIPKSAPMQPLTAEVPTTCIQSTTQNFFHASCMHWPRQRSAYQLAGCPHSALRVPRSALASSAQNERNSHVADSLHANCEKPRECSEHEENLRCYPNLRGR